MKHLLTPLLVLTLLAIAPAAWSDAITGRVVGIKDGDTIVLLDNQTRQMSIRLAQIDAPEKSQAYGQRSKQSLSSLVYGKTVQVELNGDRSYDRLVGTLFLDGRDINREQVRRGMAWVSPKYAKDPSLFTVEKQARAARAGLWVDANPTPPWEYRRNARDAGAQRR